MRDDHDSGLMLMIGPVEFPWQAALIIKLARRTAQRAAAFSALLAALLAGLTDYEQTPLEDVTSSSGEDEPPPLIRQLVADLVTAPHAPTGHREALVAA